MIGFAEGSRRHTPDYAAAQDAPTSDIFEHQLLINCAYLGTNFSGYAAQTPHIRTVEAEVARALKTILKREVELTCAGRTDAGVHAAGQAISLPISTSEIARLSPARLQRSLNALTPDDIALGPFYLADADFSARFSCIERAYIYRIYASPIRPVFGRDTRLWWREELDANAMHEAAQALMGEHDFTSFCKQTSAELIAAQGGSLKRHVDSISVTRNASTSQLIEVHVRGNAFLHNMVRIIVGSLIEVGRHKRNTDFLAQALAAHDRAAAGPTADACGLTFESAIYPTGSAHPWEESLYQ